MRSGIIGFLLGVVLMALALVLVQLGVIRDVAPDLTYRFDRYVFSGPDFPKGDFDQGRLVHRCLFPSRLTTTFYDAHYREVTRAVAPGRYGAVVRMELNGGVKEYRFITLYRMPEGFFTWRPPWPMSVQLPSDFGLDPAVLRTQQPEIGDALKNGLTNLGRPGRQLAILLAGLSETSPTAPPAVDRTNVAARDAAWWSGLRERLGLPEKYPYLIDLPHDYAADPARRWPLILYLHSAAEYGRDMELVRKSGLAGQIAAGRQLPAIVISPQCPSDEGWRPIVLTRLIDVISAKYRVDPDRIYLTGASAGGDGVWNLALAHPGRFAAIIPISGESDAADTARLKDLPIWAFQGAKDDIVPLAATTDMIDGIRRAGGHPHETIFQDGPHHIWDRVYATDAVYTWLLAQKRGQPEVPTPGVPGS